jgi:hypothetical protein
MGFPEKNLLGIPLHRTIAPGARASPPEHALAPAQRFAGRPRRKGPAMRTIACCCLALSLSFVAGCGSGDRAEVSGTVTVDGEAIKEGSISFEPAPGHKGPQAGGIITDGKYSIPAASGPGLGKNVVRLLAFRESLKQVQDPTGKPGVLTRQRVPLFPPEYNSQSTLFRDVQPGSNTFDFHVVLKGKRP